MMSLAADFGLRRRCTKRAVQPSCAALTGFADSLEADESCIHFFSKSFVLQ